VPDKPKMKRPKRSVKPLDLEKLIRGEAEPGAPESPLEFVQRRMRELDKKGDHGK
jgi:hypothetical protein